jgi:hypothetical protein
MRDEEGGKREEGGGRWEVMREEEGGGLWLGLGYELG